MKEIAKELLIRQRILDTRANFKKCKSCGKMSLTRQKQLLTCKYCFHKFQKTPPVTV